MGVKSGWAQSKKAAYRSRVKKGIDKLLEVFGGVRADLLPNVERMLSENERLKKKIEDLNNEVSCLKKEKDELKEQIEKTKA